MRIADSGELEASLYMPEVGENLVRLDFRQEERPQHSVELRLSKDQWLRLRLLLARGIALVDALDRKAPPASEFGFEDTLLFLETGRMLLTVRGGEGPGSNCLVLNPGVSWVDEATGLPQGGLVFRVVGRDAPSLSRLVLLVDAALGG